MERNKKKEEEERRRKSLLEEQAPIYREAEPPRNKKGKKNTVNPESVSNAFANNRSEDSTH